MSQSQLLRDEEIRDLGFGSVVADASRKRLLNRDGSFNVARRGLPFWASVSPYHYMLTLSWGGFLAMVVLSYFLINALFALLYLMCGPQALSSYTDNQAHNFLQAFFFSVQTFATIGYGQITPNGLTANLIVTLESLVGLLSVALATGILFARFSRPTARILFSRTAVIAPYHGITAFEFRITNARRNQIIELEAKVLFTYFDFSEGHKIRRFELLPLERNKVVFFPLSWTIVHPITAESPLHGLTALDLQRQDAEFLILLTGIDETFSQTVHARSSYKFHEIVWNAKFGSMFHLPENKPKNEGLISVDLGQLDQIEYLKGDLPSLPATMPARTKPSDPTVNAEKG
jgi:inward rectifier potassium channel